MKTPNYRVVGVTRVGQTKEVEEIIKKIKETRSIRIQVKFFATK